MEFRLVGFIIKKNNDEYTVKTKPMKTVTDPHAFNVRPRFLLVSNKSVDQICELFDNSLSDPNRRYNGKVRTGYVSIYPIKEDRHYWSPHLTISLEPSENDQNQTSISGLYGPSPEVWTMFVFFYSIIGLALVIITVIGFANLSIGESASVLWSIPILILAFVSMFVVSYFGQKKGHAQVEGMYEFMESILQRSK